MLGRLLTRIPFFFGYSHAIVLNHQVLGLCCAPSAISYPGWLTVPMPRVSSCVSTECRVLLCSPRWMLWLLPAGEQWEFRALAVVRVLTDAFCAAEWFNSRVRALDVLWQWLYKSWVLLQLFYVRGSTSDTLLGLRDRRKNPYCLCTWERCHWEKVLKAKSSSNCQYLRPKSGRNCV